MILFFDTETTGKVSWSLPANHQSQPRLVQLAAALYDANATELMTLRVLVRPVGFTIPADASAIHGITTERAATCGVDVLTALSIFHELADRASVLAAYNADFDRVVMAGEIGRATCCTWKWGDPFCVMKAATPICKLPGRYGDYKWPKLSEASKILLGEDHADAHDALGDVRATARVYFALRKAEVVA